MARNFKLIDDTLEKRKKNAERIPVLGQTGISSQPQPAVVTEQRIERPSARRERTTLPGTGEVKGNRDANIIHEYESTPNYSLLERAYEGLVSAGGAIESVRQVGKERYDQKQSMVNEYNAAKNRQISKALSEYQPQSDSTIPTLSGTYANKVLHPIQYAEAQKEIAPYLASRGITLDQLEDYYGAEAMRRQNEEAVQNAKEIPALSTLESFVTNQLGNAYSGIDAISAYLQGRPIGENQTINEYGQLTPTIRGTVREGIKENAKTKAGGAIGAGAYDLATSLGDMGMSLALGGGNQAASLGLMSFGAGAQNLNAQKGKDTTADQKIATALASGAIEAITEKIPLDNLFKLANNSAGRQTVKQIFKNVLKQAGQEATEEAVSEVANSFVDRVINGNQSDYAQSVANYVASGMTESEARTRANLDLAQNAAYSALIGGLSGGIMGGGASVINNIGASVPSIENPEAFAEYNKSQQGSNNRSSERPETYIPVLQQNAENGYADIPVYNPNPWVQNGQPTQEGLTQAQREAIIRGHQSFLNNNPDYGNDYINGQPTRNRVMAEDIGLNTRGNAVPTIRDMVNGVTLTQQVIPDDNVSQFSWNSLQNNMMQTDEGRAKVQEGIDNGDYDKGRNSTHGMDLMPNEWTEDEADRWITKHRDLLDERIKRGETTDPVVFEAVLRLTEEAEQSQNWDDMRYYSMKAAGQSTDSARILQLLAKRAKHSASTAIQKADTLIHEMTDIFMNGKNNKAKKEGCAKLATALRNIGNDHTNDSVKVEKTYQQIRDGVVAEMNKESSSVFDNFTDTDIDYMARMVEKGYSAADIQYRLEEKLATGSWEISDADLAEVTRLFNEADKEGERSKARMELEEQAYAILARYLPDTSFMDKWNAWRYLAMLGNTRTHVRNIIGNVLFGTVTNVKDGLAGTLESAFARNGERTKTAFMPTDGNLLKAARADADNVWLDLTDGGNKYNMQRDIEAQRQVFKNKWLEAVRKFNNAMLTKEDNFALRNKYQRALAGYLQANGKNADIFNSSNEADVELLERAREYAIQEAKIATFHEENSFANLMNETARKAMSPNSGLGAKLGGYLIESLVPFKKTPANILKQGAIAYNPLQVVHGLFDAITNGNNPTKAIDELSRGLTGSGIMLLGYMLASSGVLRPSKKDESGLDDLTGEQAYSINTGDGSYTIDWAAPAALPLFIGAELYKTFEDRENFDFWSAVSSVSDPVIEMSMLQGLKNSLESAASFTSGKNTLGDVAINTGYGYASQGLPTLLGQVARSVDDTSRSSYTGKKGTSDTILRNLKKTQNKIPVLSMFSEPYVDAWGQTQKNGSIPFLGDNVASRLAYNMLSPGYYSNTEKSDTEKELYRLTDEMNAGKIEKSNIIPTVADKSYNGERLSPKDYTRISIAKGQTLQTMYDEAMNDPRYGSMSDASKAELLDTLRKFGNAVSKEEVFGYDVAGSNTYKKQYEAYQHGGVSGLITYMQIKEGKAGNTTADLINAIDSLGLSDEDKVFFFKQSGPDYSEQAQYLDKYIGEKYAYDWYKIRSQYGTKKDEMLFGIMKSDLPDLEKSVLRSVLDMDKDELKFHLVTGK